MGCGYLSLTRHNKQYIAVYRIDENGNPIISDEDVLVIKVLNISDSRVKLGFNRDAYEIVRTEVLEGIEKEFVDNKIRRLEDKFKEKE